MDRGETPPALHFTVTGPAVCFRNIPYINERIRGKAVVIKILDGPRFSNSFIEKRGSSFTQSVAMSGV